MALFTAAEALQMAMEIETNGEAFYQAVAAQTANPDVKALFEDLAVQERGHYRVFERMLEEVKPAPEFPAADYDEYKTYLQTTLDNALFAGPDKALTMADEAQDWEAAIRVAIGFEKDTLLFFYDVREMVSEADREAISGVIREEKRHLRQLAKKL
jgi:rubrerythrin